MAQVWYGTGVVWQRCDLAQVWYGTRWHICCCLFSVHAGMGVGQKACGIGILRTCRILQHYLKTAHQQQAAHQYGPPLHICSASVWCSSRHPQSSGPSALPLRLRSITQSQSQTHTACAPRAPKSTFEPQVHHTHIHTHSPCAMHALITLGTTGPACYQSCTHTQRTYTNDTARVSHTSHPRPSPTPAPQLQHAAAHACVLLDERLQHHHMRPQHTRMARPLAPSTLKTCHWPPPRTSGPARGYACACPP